MGANTTAGSYNVTAFTTPGTPGVTFSLTNTPGNAASFAIGGLPATVSATVPQQVTVTARDQYGNVATGYTGTVQLTDTAMLGVSPTSVAFAPADMGVKTATVTFTTGTGGTTTFRATDSTTSSITGSQSVTVRAAPPRITGYTPNRSTAGQSASVTITGSGFQLGTTVTIGSTPATVTNTTLTSLTFTVPASLASDTYTITVTNPDTQTATAGPFAVYPSTGVPAVPGCG